MSPVAVEWASADKAPAPPPEPADAPALDEELALEAPVLDVAGAAEPLEELLEEPQPVTASAARTAPVTQSFCVLSMS